MRRVLTLISLLLALVLVAPASAQQSCEAPPGTSAVDEYCETVPEAGGSRSADARPDRPVALPSGTAKELARSGPDGEALLRQLGYDPAKVGEQANENRSAPVEARPGGEPAPKEPSFNALDTVGQIISSGPTVGGGFGFVLLAIVLAMLGWGWIDYRRRTAAD